MISFGYLIQLSCWSPNDRWTAHESWCQTCHHQYHTQYESICPGNHVRYDEFWIWYTNNQNVRPYQCLQKVNPLLMHQQKVWRSKQMLFSGLLSCCHLSICSCARRRRHVVTPGSVDPRSQSDSGISLARTLLLSDLGIRLPVRYTVDYRTTM